MDLPGRPFLPTPEGGGTQVAIQWRRVWREAIAPLLDWNDLEHLAEGLRRDDPTLIQGATTQPPSLQCTQDWEVEGCCALGYIGWKKGLETVGETEEFFARLCFQIDSSLGEPAGCRWFINWFDACPRDEMRRLLLEEIDWVRSQREALEKDSSLAEKSALN